MRFFVITLDRDPKRIENVKNNVLNKIPNCEIIKAIDWKKDPESLDPIQLLKDIDEVAIDIKSGVNLHDINEYVGTQADKELLKRFVL